MALQFLFLNLAILSAGIVLVLLVRAWPRLDGATVRRSMWERWLTSDLPKRFDQALSIFFMRLLRRARILSLKAHNVIEAKLERMKLERGEGIGGPKPDLTSLSGDKKEEGQND